MCSLAIKYLALESVLLSRSQIQNPLDPNCLLKKIFIYNDSFLNIKNEKTIKYCSNI